MFEGFSMQVYMTEEPWVSYISLSLRTHYVLWYRAALFGEGGFLNKVCVHKVINNKRTLV